MNIRYHPEAREELLPAIQFSEAKFGRGKNLLEKVEDVENDRREYPKMGEIEEEPIRR